MSSHVVEPRLAVSGHRVPRALIEQVFAGPVDASAMAALLDGQHSRRLLLLLEFLRESASTPAVQDARRVLIAAEKRAPDIVRDILLYPSVGTWLVRVIRKIRDIVDDDVPIRVDMGYLGSIAVAAAVRSGIDAKATAPVWGGRLNLPTVGQFDVAGDDSPHLVRLWTKDSAVHLDSGDGKWIPLDKTQALPLHVHRSTARGRTMRWTVDDTDPYREFAGMSSPARLTHDEFELWRRTLDQAWAILVDEHADYVPEVSAVAPVIVPAIRVGGFVAASSSTAFGAIRAAMPDTPAAMAETLLHEIQHSKLNALLDLVPLQRSGPDRFCYAPWRRDPRPLSGLLHGIYAFVGVTEYWYRRWRSNQDPANRTAAFHFVLHGRQVREALREPRDSELTDVGARFLDVAAARLDACGEGAAPADLRDLITLLCAENRLTWRIRHLEPSAEHVDELAGRWSAGERCPARAVEPALCPFHRPDTESALPVLLTDRALDPASPAVPAGARAGECELVNQDVGAARPAFAERIRRDPDDDGAWVGLLLALAAHRDESLPAEAVSATYRRVAAAGGAPPDPVTLVEWFGQR
jgi:HEXXH motif-containing protein